MNPYNGLIEQSEAHRPYLRAMTFRMLGSPSEADDAVQEGWLRLSRSDTSAVENLPGTALQYQEPSERLSLPLDTIPSLLLF